MTEPPDTDSAFENPRFSLQIQIYALILIISAVVIVVFYVFAIWPRMTDGISQADAASVRIDMFNFSAAVLAAATAVCGAVYARSIGIESLKRQKKQGEDAALLTRTLVRRDRQRNSYTILRFMDEERKVQLRIEIREKFEPIANDRAQIKQLMEDEPSWDEKISKVLGSLEDMALAIRSRHADERVLYYSMNLPLVRTVKVLQGYIDMVRAEDTVAGNVDHRKTIYQEATDLANSWSDGESIVHGKRFPRISDADRFDSRRWG